MKKSLVLTSALILGGLTAAFTATTAHAVSTATTNGTLSVTKPDAENPEDTAPVAPVDPNNPDDTFVPDNPNQGTPGLLTIDQAPDFDFGSVKLGTAQTKYAALQSGTSSTGAATSVQNYVQVTDKSGNYAGWTLSVKRSEFVGAKSADNKLTGSTVTFKNAIVRASATNGQGTPSTVAGAGAAGIEIPVNQEVNLVTAAANEGLGTWIYSLGTDAAQGAEAVELKIPVSNYVEDAYVATFDWKLTEAPTGTPTP